MDFKTPFSVKNGLFYDRDRVEIDISCRDYKLNRDNHIEVDLLAFRREQVNMIRLEIDETSIADANGRLTNVQLLDMAIEAIHRNGFYLLLIPVTNGNRTPFSPESITRQQCYLSELFTHRNELSAKTLPEYENLIGVEMLFDMNCFSDSQFELYTSRVMLQVYMEHYFGGGALRLYCLDHDTPSAKRLEIMHKNGMEIVSAAVFERKDRSYVLQTENFIPGIRPAVMTARLGRADTPGWRPVAVGAATSMMRHPHENGGSEGFLSFAAEVAVNLRIDFPCAVRTAIFRPSLQKRIPVNIDDRTVTFTLPSPLYGSLEINYFMEDEPAYTVYILGDRITPIPAVGKIKTIAPGTHRLEDLKCGDADVLHFLPGLHDVEGRLLHLESGKKVFLERGATVRAGVLAEQTESTMLYGQGILDGSLCKRDVGENKGDRMGEKWIADQGYEGFICFHKCKSIEFDGPLVYNPQFWNFVISGTDNCTVRNYKTISWIQNNDGIQPRSCNNLLVERCFMKCNDDGVAIKTRRSFDMISGHLVFRDLVLWNDRCGCALEIGHTSQGDVLEDIRFENIKVINSILYPIHVCIIDHSTVQNVSYDGIFVEGRPPRGDFGFVICPGYYTTDKEPGKIQNISVSNYFSEHPHLPGEILGFDEDHKVENVTFHNIVFNCRKNHSPVEQLFWNKFEFTEKINITKE
ncbi:MAG: hypothetical protein JXR78_06805 [Victivallales bacterium]|nr:hypothetical protein [Victivallales bacterium]